MGVVSSGPPSSSALLPKGIPNAVRRLKVDPPQIITVTTTINKVAGREVGVCITITFLPREILRIYLSASFDVTLEECFLLTRRRRLLHADQKETACAENDFIYFYFDQKQMFILKDFSPTCKGAEILCFRPKFKMNDSGYMLMALKNNQNLKTIGSFRSFLKSN